MQQRLGDDLEPEPEDTKRMKIVYRVGQIIGITLILTASWLSWNEVAPKFGAPHLSEIEFLSLAWIVYFFSRIIRAKM